jgi:hypothetical protein
VADALILEKRGIPSVMICAQGFTASASAMARREGFKEYEYIVISQPFSSLSREQVRQRATEVLPQVLSILGVTEEFAVATGGSS